MKIRKILFVAIIVCILSGSSEFTKSLIVGSGIGQKATNWQSVIPDIYKGDYDYLLIVVYGQSYTVATDGQYKVTQELDNALYAFDGAINSVTANTLGHLNETVSADIENTGNSAADVICKITRKYSCKSPLFIINNQGLGSRTCLELMKQSSIQSLLTQSEWEEFSQSSYYKNRYSRITTFLSNLSAWATANNKKILCPCVIFLQGESDTHIGVTGHGSISSCGGDYDTYKERLSIMLSDLKNDIMAATGQEVAPAALIDNIGNGQFNDSLGGISQAQTDVCKEMDGVFSCGPYYAYPSYGAHPTPDGRRWIGEAIAKLFYSTFIDSMVRSMNVDGYSISGNKVFLNVKTHNPPIMLDNYTSKEQINGGFMAFDSKMNEIIINSVTVKDTQIVLSFDSLPKEDFFISYGSSGYGNVRDSDDWESTYRYSSNDIGNMSGLSHYPVDESGKTFIGRHYPMWNWLPFGFVRIRL